MTAAALVAGQALGSIGNHLWQSTLFAIVAALLALGLRRHRAEVRYWLWLAASTAGCGRAAADLLM
jgi:hypothetical protein